MTLLGGGGGLMSEVPLYGRGGGERERSGYGQQTFKLFPLVTDPLSPSLSLRQACAAHLSLSLALALSLSRSLALSLSRSLSVRPASRLPTTGVVFRVWGVGLFLHIMYLYISF